MAVHLDVAVAQLQADHKAGAAATKIVKPDSGAQAVAGIALEAISSTDLTPDKACRTLMQLELMVRRETTAVADVYQQRREEMSRLLEERRKENEVLLARIAEAERAKKKAEADLQDIRRTMQDQMAKVREAEAQANNAYETAAKALVRDMEQMNTAVNSIKSAIDQTNATIDQVRRQPRIVHLPHNPYARDDYDDGCRTGNR